jgi:hypothetical protein
MLTVAATCRMHWLDRFASLAGICTASKAGHFDLAVPQLLAVTALPQSALRLPRTWPDQSKVGRSQLTPVNGRDRPGCRGWVRNPWGNQALRSLHPHLHPAVVAIWRANPPSTPSLDVLAHPGTKNPGS